MKPYNLESFLFIKNVSIMKNRTDFRKTVETDVDPRLVFAHGYGKANIFAMTLT